MYNTDHTGLISSVKKNFDETRNRIKDDINNPSHYTHGKIQTIEVIEDWEMNFHLGNVIKYISRAGRKEDRLKDLKKAQWYLNREISRLE